MATKSILQRRRLIDSCFIKVEKNLKEKNLISFVANYVNIVRREEVCALDLECLSFVSGMPSLYKPRLLNKDLLRAICRRLTTGNCGCRRASHATHDEIFMSNGIIFNHLSTLFHF
jgi:hypothetical protein